MRIVHRYMAVSAGAAFIPIVGADVVTLAGIHVALVKQLCEHYQIDFTDHTARNVLIALGVSVIPGTVGSMLSRRLLRVLPATGTVFGWMLMSAGSAAFSYAIGRLFIEHFEAGGTLDSFDTTRLRALQLRSAFL